MPESEAPITAPPRPSPAAGPGPHGAGRGGPPSRRRKWVVLVAVVVAAGLVLAALLATGILPLGRPGPAAPAFSPTFQGASGEGQEAANAVAGGPWDPAAGVAVRLPLSITVPATNLTGAIASFETTSGCNLTTPSTTPAEVVVAGTPGAAGPGASAFWVVLYVNGTGGAVGVMVNGGVSSELFSLWGNSTCTNTLRYLVPFPSGSPDSSSVLAAVNAAGGAAFLDSHQNATQVFVGLSIVLLLPAWEVFYTTCSPTLVAGATGEQFNASVSGTTVQSHSNGTVSCSVPGNLTLPGGLRPPGPSALPSLAAAGAAIGKAI